MANSFRIHFGVFNCDKAEMSIPEQFADGKIILECPEIRIEQGGRMPLHLEGPGRIELSEFRIEWSFHITAEQRASLHPVQQLGMAAFRNLGSVLPKEEYVVFRATTFDGDIWTTTIARDPHIGGPVGGAGVVAGYAFILENAKPAEASSREYARFYIPGKVNFPALFWTDTVSRGPEDIVRPLRRARNWAQFESGGDLFTLYYEGNHTMICCELTAGGIAAQRHRRMHEALTFTLGQVLRPCAEEITVNGNRITTLREWSELGRDARAQDPPLRFGDNLPLEEVYDIARAYYQMVSCWPSDQESPIGAGVFSIVHAAQSPVELHLLQVAIAAENLIKNTELDIPSAEPDFYSKVAKLREEVMQREDLTEEVRNRVGNAFGIVLQPNRLKDFVRHHGMPESVFNSWRELRNVGAHGGRVRFDDLNRLWKQRAEVLQLCHSIVFAFIGYSGIYTDYTKPRAPYSAPPKLYLQSTLPRSSEEKEV
jgi:hypothetical protein